MGVLDFASPPSADLLVRLNDLWKFSLVAFSCAWAISYVYRRIASNKPDELEFASTIFILTIAIGLLVQIIKQAPALSFGLFGAMSIIRFRTQIKRPRRMIFILMSVSIGVCCGAGEYLMTLVGTAVLSGLSFYLFGTDEHQASLPAQSAAPLPATGVGETNAPPNVTGAPTAHTRPTARWGMDLVPASHAEGRLRVLVIADEATHEVLATVVDSEISGRKIVRELDRLADQRGRPALIVGEGWPEFNGRRMQEWRQQSNVMWEPYDPEAGADKQPYVLQASRALALDCLIPCGEDALDEIRSAVAEWQSDHNDDLARSNPPPVVATAAQTAAPRFASIPNDGTAGERLAVGAVSRRPKWSASS